MRQIGDKNAGTADTIKVMSQLAVSGSQHPGIRMAAERVTRGLGSKDYEGELRAIFDLVKDNVRYVLDPRAYEFVSHPAWTLFVSGQEDCDGGATLLCALALAAGHGCAFRTVAADPSRPDEFSHVYAVLGAKGRWWAADWTHPTPAEATFGWEPPADSVYSVRDWPVAPA